MFRIYLPALVFILCGSSLDANGRTLAGKIRTIPSLIHPSNDSSVRACSSPYELIGNHCLFIDNDLVGTWEQIRTFCQAISGELVSLEDLNSLANIFTYVMTNGMNDVSYWMGANDLASEGQWIWSSNGSSVRMGMPAWGDDDSFNMYPSIDSRKNCAFLNKDGYYFLEDTVCEDLQAAICEQAPFVAHNFESTISSANDKGVEGCVHPFQLIGNACLLIDTLNPDSYENKQSLCAELGGHMAKIVDDNLLAAIYDFLVLNDIIHQDLFIGATASDESGNWKWYDGTSMQQGTPFWGDGSVPQQPDNGYYPNLACLARHDHFYFHDVPSGGQGGVICQYDQ